MILLARLLYRALISRENFETCYQHFDAYFDKIWYKKINILYRKIMML